MCETFGFQPCAESFDYAQGKLRRSKRASCPRALAGVTRAVPANACPERSRRNAHHLAALDPSASSGLALEGRVAQSPDHVVTVGTFNRVNAQTLERVNDGIRQRIVPLLQRANAVTLA
jgi:hypothetical protein